MTTVSHRDCAAVLQGGLHSISHYYSDRLILGEMHNRTCTGAPPLGSPTMDAHRMAVRMQQGRIMADAFAPGDTPASCAQPWSDFVDVVALGPDSDPTNDVIRSMGFNGPYLSDALAKARTCTDDARGAMLTAVEANCKGVPPGVYAAMATALGTSLQQQLQLRRQVVDSRPAVGCLSGPEIVRGECNS